MNHYGALAQDHWARWLPQRYATIQDPDSYFSSLGNQVASQIADLALDLAGPDPAGEDYLTKVGRLNMARLQAEEIILREQILLPPEPGSLDSEETAEPDSPAQQELPLIVDPDHPLWEQVNAEQEHLAQGK